MKLQFKHQKFQADAAKAVVDVFAGQPASSVSRYLIDRGLEKMDQIDVEGMAFTGWRNEPIIPALSDALILEHIQKIQRANQIKPSTKLEGRDDGYNLTIEMETGVGKTYTYIKTMYQKASVIIEHITYNVLDDRYGKEVFTDTTIRGKLGVNAVKANRSIYDHVVYDSENERKFVSDLDIRDEVAVYVKLPDGFFIPTPIGKYNPDWAIAFYEGSVKHIYFVAETKGSMETLMFEDHTSTPEKAKIHCAKQHFKAISNGEVMYHVVDNYQDLLNIVTK